MEEQLKKQYNRLQELKRAKSENSGKFCELYRYFKSDASLQDAFFGAEDPFLHNVDVKTDVSTPFTTFTRYTVAPTSTSRSISGLLSSAALMFLDG